MIVVFANPRTFTRLLYLILSFPLGLMYFLMLVIGFALGGSLSIIGIGIAILFATFFGAAAAAAFERRLSNALLGTNIPPVQYMQPGAGILDQIKLLFKDGRIIRDIVYLFMRFPFGIGALILSILTVAIPLGFIFAPFYYGTPDAADMVIVENVTTLAGALAVSVLGVFMLPVMLFVDKLALDVWSGITAAMLGGGERDYDDYGKVKRHTVTVPAGKMKNEYRDDMAYQSQSQVQQTAHVNDVADVTLDDSREERSLTELIDEVIQEKKSGA